MHIPCILKRDRFFLNQCFNILIINAFTENFKTHFQPNFDILKCILQFWGKLDFIGSFFDLLFNIILWLQISVWLSYKVKIF